MDPSDKQLRIMIDTIPALAWCCFPDGTTEFSNRRWLEYTGLSQDEALSWGWQRAVHPDDLDNLMEAWRFILASGEAGGGEFRLRRYDGEYRWFLFRAEPFRGEDGESVRWYGISTDIQDRKQAEEKLREDEHEFHRITDAIAQSIAVYDPEGNVIYANQTLLDYVGLTIDEVLRPDCPARTVHPDDFERLRHTREAALRRGLPYEIEIRLRRKDGEYRWFLHRCKPFRDEHGRLTRWYSTATDIEDRKQAEERVQNENLALREEIDKISMFEEIVGTSPALQAVLSRANKVAPTESTILVTGETGTGKELIARAIHKRSRRSSRAFVSVNCAAIPQALIASELFGHEKGAFTGASQRRIGRFEMAEGGTLFLDEIGELPCETQIALLRVLQERQFERVGSNHTIPADVRVIAATNRDLEAAIETGDFRSDLFYRLNVFPIEIPPLRERPDDVQMLVEYFIHRYASQAGKKISNISKKTMDLLRSYSWPGNVRELQNVVERSVILCETATFSVDESWLRGRAAPQGSVPLQPAIQYRTKEKEQIEEVLAETRGRIAGPSGAATRLGMRPSTLESKIRSLNIDKYRFRDSGRITSNSLPLRSNGGRTQGNSRV